MIRIRSRSYVEGLAIGTERPRWHRRAACNGLGADLFHPEGKQGGSTFHSGPWSVCEQCPVSGECLEYALELEAGLPRLYRQGLYAFSTPTERQRIDDGAPPYDGRHCDTVRGWQKHKLWGQEPCADCQRRWDEYKAAHPGEIVRLERPPLRAVDSAKRQAPKPTFRLRPATYAELERHCMLDKPGSARFMVLELPAVSQ